MRDFNDEGKMAKPKKRTARGRASEPKGAVSLAASGDLGAMGAANRSRVVVETVKDDDAGHGTMKRARVVDMLDVWMGNGTISTEQWNTAVILRAAWERTQQTPGTDYARPRVDSSPKPDHAIAIQTDRISKLRAAWANIRPTDEPIVLHCVIDGLIPATLRMPSGRRPYRGANYQMGLQALRDALDRAGVK
jgi:hypothetical protein